MPLLSDTPDKTNDTKAYKTNNTEAHHNIHNTCQDIEACAQGQRGFVAVPYPDPCAGQRISQHSPDYSANIMYGMQLVDDENDENLYYPFASKIEWEVARWAKLRRSSSTAFSDLLSIDGQVIIAGEAFDVYYHNIIECVKSLCGDPNFARYLTFAPEQHYTNDDQTVHLFHDMHTGKWWWETQKKLDERHPGGTIVPIIISSDKTQVTMFRNKTAYPVYLTIGNIPKEIRCKPSSGSHILLAYLPTTRLEHITNKASHHRTNANLYHACLCHVLAPLKSAGSEGIFIHCHPLFASFVGDYPEQLLATGVKFGECPKCDVEAKDTGSNMTPFHMQKLSEVLDALAAFDHGNLAFVHACATAGIKPIIHPFWEDLPFANIFHAITPDHLLGWLSEACGAAEIDACCQRLPPNHHICLFTKGITCLSHVSVRGLLDFLYLTQYPCHSSETLHSLDEALDLFHENKDIFIQLGIQNNFNLLKLHAACHYHLMITLFGTTYNYNIEYTECLHIDLAKDAYRATNHKDDWCLAGDHQFEPYHSFMTKHPSTKAVSIQKLVEDYGATHFCEALACYIACHSQSDHPAPLQNQALDHLAGNICFPFHSLPVFHKIKWCSIDTGGHTGHVTLDSAHAKPQQKLGSCLIDRQSDTVLVSLHKDSVTNDLEGFCISQIQAILSLPPKSIQLLFPPTVSVPPHLAYIEWFMPFPSAPDRNNGLYKQSRLMHGSDRVASIMPVGDIVHSVHLIPKFGDTAPREWKSETVLEDCNMFWLNSYIDRHTFLIFR
ncbi:hypothetical protein BD769DRAFT_1628787 [Suillus cothurnatus]|nr:hypothetical protein BD769DRAFT_1628787 [Suillus cothurnatus]